MDCLDSTSINGLNLYAYCNNDPINKLGPSGHFVIWLTCMLVGMAAALIATAIIDASDGKMDTDAKYYIANTLMGGLIGIGVGLAW